MTWTYSGNPSSSATDAIRFLIGDTDANDQLLSNEEIQWVNTQASGSATSTATLYDSAYRCCMYVASKLAREADKQIGDLRVSMSQKAESYRKQAAILQAQSKEYNFVPIPYAGGLSISDKEIDDDNSDSFRPWFQSGQFQNVQDGAARQSQTGIQYFGPGADS